MRKGKPGLRCIGIYKKFDQYERIRRLFKDHGYDMDKERKRVLARAGRLKAKIIDVGTGPGRMAYTIAKAGYRVISVDISGEAQRVAVIYARRRRVFRKINLITMDAQKMGFKDGSFNTAVSVNLLHDVGNPAEVVREISRVTRPGGKIIISDLNRKGKELVNKVYRIDKEIHRGRSLDFCKAVEIPFKKMGICYKKYEDGFITTYIGQKNLLLIKKIKNDCIN